MNLEERFRRFNLRDFIISYLAKFIFGVGIGVILTRYLRAWGWVLIGVAIIISIPLEYKFWIKKKRSSLPT